MSSEAATAAVRYRLKEWALQVRECQNRSLGMSVVDWCASHGITKANYYYRLRRVREACLKNFPPEAPAQQIIPVNPGFLRQEIQSDADTQQGLSVSVDGKTIYRNGKPLLYTAAALCFLL